MANYLLYAHLDGTDVLEYDQHTSQLVASNGETSTAILIGPVGLIELGREMLQIGMKLANKAEVPVND